MKKNESKLPWLLGLGLLFAGAALVVATAQQRPAPALTDSPATPTIETESQRETDSERPPLRVLEAEPPDLREPHIGRQISDALADSVEQALPAVVTVKTSATRIGRDFWRSYLFDAQVGQGSGVIIDPKGYLITNKHVLEGAEDVKVELSDGREMDAEFIGSNAQTDIAVLRIRGKGPFQAIRIADSDETRVGELVMAVGAPYSLTSTVTQGVISQKGRGWEQMPLVDFIQTSAAINPGNSGGALIDIEGQLIGINTFIQTAPGTRGSIGLGFAVPSNIAMRIARLIIENKNSDLAWLGVIMAQTEYGVFIRRLVEDGPAKAASIKPGDLVRSVDGRPIRTTEELRTYMTIVSPGNTVRLGVLRGESRLEVPVKTSSMPDLTTLYK